MRGGGGGGKKEIKEESPSDKGKKAKGFLSRGSEGGGGVGGGRCSGPPGAQKEATGEREKEEDFENSFFNELEKVWSIPTWNAMG
ncbi:hypothetical protein RUM43_000643 [Polyplax serrata]|uniref:Uncharacterized protein n=1 Tax=Polyplax serrata TaxID=468196 RepID=A0AAN8SE84_POLSC